MKKESMKVGIFAVLVMIVGWNYQQSKQSVELSGLAMANVEALAGPEGEGQSKRYITDEIQSMEILEDGIKTTYYRHCSYGGSQYCVTGTWTGFTPKK